MTKSAWVNVGHIARDVDISRLYFLLNVLLQYASSEYKYKYNIVLVFNFLQTFQFEFNVRNWLLVLVRVPVLPVITFGIEVPVEIVLPNETYCTSTSYWDPP